MKIKKTKEYNEIFEFLTKAEMEARNGNFMTCGTWCKNAMELSFKFGNNENLNKKLGPILNDISGIWYTKFYVNVLLFSVSF